MSDQPPSDPAEPADEPPAEPVESDVPPPPPLPQAGEPLEQIVDDVQPRQEAHAWAWAQMRHGRDGEDVVQDLVAAGWDQDEAEGLVESARKSEGALEAVANAPLPPMSMRGMGVPGLRLVYYLVGLVERMFRGASAVEEERARRKNQPPTQ